MADKIFEVVHEGHSDILRWVEEQIKKREKKGEGQ